MFFKIALLKHTLSTAFDDFWTRIVGFQLIGGNIYEISA